MEADDILVPHGVNTQVSLLLLLQGNEWFNYKPPQLPTGLPDLLVPLHPLDGPPLLDLIGIDQTGLVSPPVSISEQNLLLFYSLNPILLPNYSTRHSPRPAYPIQSPL